MPRIEMPSTKADGSNNWIEYRDELKVRDRLAVQEVATIQLGENSNSMSMLAMQNDMRNALLGRIITAWSYDFPTPANNHFVAADVAIGEMDLDDYAVLEKAVQPLMEKIAGRGAADPKKQPQD
jgi:hypothetical protein